MHDDTYLRLQDVPSCTLPNKLKVSQLGVNKHQAGQPTLDKHTQTNSRFLPPIITAYLATNSASEVVQSAPYPADPSEGVRPEEQ